MDVRICGNGHQVPQEDLKACPACGASLAEAEWVETEDPPESPAPTPTREDEEPEAVPQVPAAISSIPAGLVLLVPGVVLGLLGWLVVAAADGRGTASGGGIILLALAGILSTIGIIAIGVRVGINDTRPS